MHLMGCHYMKSFNITLWVICWAFLLHSAKNILLSFLFLTVNAFLASVHSSTLFSLSAVWPHGLVSLGFEKHVISVGWFQCLHLVWNSNVFISQWVSAHILLCLMFGLEKRAEWELWCCLWMSGFSLNLFFHSLLNPHCCLLHLLNQLILSCHMHSKL